MKASIGFRPGIALGLATVLVSAGLAQGATLFGLTDDNNLIQFDSNQPSTVDNAVGLRTAANAPIQDLIGIDFRPNNGLLYGVGRFGAVYTIDRSSGVATQVSQLSVNLNGSRFGLDFNPTNNLLRITSNTDQNLSVDVTTGAATVQTALAYQAGDINQNRDPNIVGSAYLNNDNNPATGTTLYNIDSVQNTLVTQNTPQSGQLQTVGGSNIDFSSLAGFDIGQDGTNLNAAFAVLQEVNTGVSRLYRVNLATGIASGGDVVGGGDLLDGLAIAPIPEPTTLAAVGLLALGIARRPGRKA